MTDVHRDGEGWGRDLDLPHGVTAEMILARREQLASGLRRPLSATWPEAVPHEHEGRARLWVGYQDMAKVEAAGVAAAAAPGRPTCSSRCRSAPTRAAGRSTCRCSRSTG